MTDELRDVEAKLLMERLNQRARLLAIVTGKQAQGFWLLTCLGIAVAGSAVFICGILLFDAGSSNLISFAIMLGLFSYVVALQAEHFNKRMKALIELLEQNGVLQGTFPPSIALSGKTTTSQSNQAGGETGADSANAK